MDRHELNEMFDGLTPDPARERELLRQLLQDDARRKQPMKHWKRVVIGVAAAALLVTVAAAATVPGISASLRRLLSIEPGDIQSMELLAPGAMEVDVTVESNGATLHITQVLRDQVKIVLVGEFATAEGTVLDTGDFGSSCWKPDVFRAHLPVFLNADGEPLELDYRGGRQAMWWSMPDEDPLDNRCSVYFVYTGYSEDMVDDIAAMRVEAKNFAYYAGGKEENYTTISGDWSFDVPLSRQNLGSSWKTDELITNLDGADISLRKVYLSPMELELTCVREGGSILPADADQDEELRWESFPLRAVLTDQDGNCVTLDWSGGGGGTADGMMVMRFIIADFIALDKKGDYIDPARFQGGTLRLEWRAENGGTDSASFSLDDLQPISP
ncbi:MAG: hypothetical protein HDT35_07095 [Clostridiales bacterium]|nr:hypothetical protein [Clostridiales bacterium]